MIEGIQVKGWDSSRFSADVRKIAGRGIGAAAIHLTNRIKQVVSVPAPRRIVKFSRSKVKTKRIYAATPAVPGAPPRKLTGKLRQSITWQWMKKDLVARVGTGIIYGASLEFGPKKFRGKKGEGAHPFISVTVQKAKNELALIIGKGFNSGGSNGAA